VKTKPKRLVCQTVRAWRWPRVHNFCFTVSACSSYTHPVRPPSKRGFGGAENPAGDAMFAEASKNYSAAQHYGLARCQEKERCAGRDIQCGDGGCCLHDGEERHDAARSDMKLPLSDTATWLARGDCAHCACAVTPHSWVSVEHVGARVPAAPMESSRASPPHTPRYDGLTHPCRHCKIQSCCHLGSAFEVASFQTPSPTSLRDLQ
jgi:hypothetical protein